MTLRTPAFIPIIFANVEELATARKWMVAVLEDIAAGKHAVGCECLMVYNCAVPQPDNGCITIARAALAGEPYTIEGDE